MASSAPFWGPGSISGQRTPEKLFLPHCIGGFQKGTREETNINKYALVLAMGLEGLYLLSHFLLTSSSTETHGYSDFHKWSSETL